MAMILDAFMPTFSAFLLQMQRDVVATLLGVPNEIDKLRQTIGDIQCVIADAEKKQIDSKGIKRWLMELKDVMYDANDVMDLCKMKDRERRERSESSSSSKPGCGFLPSLSCFRNPSFAHKIGTKIKEINSRLEGIAKRKADLGLIELQNVTGRSPVRPVDTFVSRTTDPLVVLEDIVGEKIEEDASLLISWLVEEGDDVRENISVVAIVGMGGIGKTTLAKRVFNDPKMEEFQIKIWTCVSKQKGIDVLKCVIRGAGGDHGARQERSELVPLLKDRIEGKKFLLVLDDVWPENMKFWDDLLRAPLMGGAHGSRLLVTTRDDRVANGMRATELHRVGKLSEEDGWSLLIKQVFQNEEEFEVQELKDIGLSLVDKCDYLPLAIKSIGGVLRMKGRTRREWLAISESDVWSWSIDGRPGDLHHAFYLSYEDLPSPLKQCFIFCSLFPEDFIYDRSQLIYLWFAEGFLQDDGNLWKLGSEYYKELMLRNLLEYSKESYDQSRCKMHDLLWSFARYLGKEENLILIQGDGIPKQENSSKLRRLSIEENVANTKVVGKEKWLRTLLISDVPDNALADLCKTLRNLRILDLSCSNISILPDALSCLVLLRYLDVSNSEKLKIIPNSIGSLRNLVYLCFLGCSKLSHCPPSITNLKQLRFLCFEATTVERLPTGLNNLENLIELRGFSPDSNNLNGFSNLGELEALSQLVTLQLTGLERVSEKNTARTAKLWRMERLQKLFLNYSSMNWEDQVSQTDENKKTVEGVLNELSPPRCMEILVISDYFGNFLPKWLNLGTTLSNLRYLYIKNCNCFKSLVSFGQLPNLDHLRIIGAYSVVSIGEELFWTDTGSRDSRTAIPPFPKLNKLVLKGMPNFKKWQWNKGKPAMPKLRELFIEACPQLRCLPEGLMHHATSLEKLQIDGADNLVTIENFPSVKRINLINIPNLERISNLPSVSRIDLIKDCPNIKTVEKLNKSLQWMRLLDSKMEFLPEYLMTAMPQQLRIDCSGELLRKITSQGVEGSEWQKFKHIPKVKIYSRDDSLYATYQRTPFSFTSNIN